MSARDNGGSVHPVLGFSREDDHYGMSLRDWFAGQALAGLMAGLGADKDWNPSMDEVARNVYAQADAMLKARGTP